MEGIPSYAPAYARPPNPNRPNKKRYFNNSN